MNKQTWIKGVRNYLDEPIMGHLHILSHKTENIEELEKLLKRAKSLMGSYVEDANYYLNIGIEKNNVT